MSLDFDPYSILGISHNANADDIKRAHRRLAQRLHPDVNPNNVGGSEQFQDITIARDALIDPDMRKRVDARLDLVRATLDFGDQHAALGVVLNFRERSRRRPLRLWLCGP